MNKISKSIMLMVPGSGCNLQCSYCYAWRTSRPKTETNSTLFKYTVEKMIRAFRRERIGGYAEIVVIGSAETLVREEVIAVVHGLLNEGHVVTLVTNATLSKQVDKLLDVKNKEILKNLIFKASFHYLELKKKNLLGVYFENIKKVLKSGASAYPFLVVSEEYVSYLEEIAKVCRENLGNTPHCTPCINYNDGFDMDAIVDVQLADDEEKTSEVKRLFDSKIYEETLRYTKIDVQNYYCYAGRWSYKVNMGTGAVARCHGLMTTRNFFEDVDCKFEIDEVVACSCGIATCALQYNFFSLGLLPEVSCKYMYGDLIYKEGFITEHVRNRLNVNFKDINVGDNEKKRYGIVLKNKNRQLEISRNIINWMNRSLGNLDGVDYSKLIENPFVNRKIYNAINKGCLIGVYGTGGAYEAAKWAVNFKIDFFVKSDAHDNERFENLKVYKPEQLSALTKRVFLIIVSTYKSEIIEKLEKLGYVNGIDFI